MFEFFMNCEENFGMLFAGHSFIFENNSSKKICFDNICDINFQIYSCNNPSLIFPVLIKFDQNRWFSTTKYANLTQISQNKYICEINICENLLNNKKSKKIILDSLCFNFFENGNIEIESENNLLFSENFDIKIENAKVISLDNNFYAINIFSSNDKEKTIIINNEFKCEKIFENAIFEKTENGFKVLQEVFDIANHGIVSIYNFDNGLKKIDEYSVYMKNHTLNNFAPKVLPLYFLQCVKANDFSQAKRFLTENIKQKVSNQGIKSYFGDFVDVVCFENDFYLKYQNSQKWNFDAKKCQFSINDGKITSINLI